MWDLSSPTRDGTHVPCIGRRILSHWTTREVSSAVFFLFILQVTVVAYVVYSYKIFGPVVYLFLWFPLSVPAKEAYPVYFATRRLLDLEGGVPESVPKNSIHSCSPSGYL